LDEFASTAALSSTHSGWSGDPITRNITWDHHSDHENGGDQEISVAGLSGLLADEQTPLQHSVASGAGTKHSPALGATEALELNAFTTPSTLTSGILDIDHKTATAGAKGASIETTITASIAGVAVVDARIISTAGQLNKDHAIYKATVTGHASDDSDSEYSCFQAIADGTGSADRVAFDVLSTVFDYALLAHSGSIAWVDTAGVVQTERETPGDGDDLSLLGGDGDASAAEDRAGGDVIVCGGAKANSGADGNVYLAHTGSAAQGRVGVGTNAPNAACLIDMVSTTQGFRPPQMTAAQRTAIGSPVAGMMLYQTDNSRLEVYNGAQWRAITTSPIATLAVGGIAFALSDCCIDCDETKLFWDNTAKALAIGAGSVNASALLDLVSTAKGFLPPRMTTAQRNAISSAAEGLVIYNTTTQVLEFYNGSSWGAV
jgi:hypothetical protein